MGLTPEIIAIIAVVFGGSFVLMIIFGIMQSRRKKRASAFASQNSANAILHIYGHGPKINGTRIQDMEHIRGENLQHTVALPPGRHTIAAKYASSEPAVTGNTNYKAPALDCEIDLEAGHEYTLAMYFYSPEQRYNYYKGDVGEAVFSLPLQADGAVLGGHSAAYIICYKEK